MSEFLFVPIVVRFSQTSLFGARSLLHICDHSNFRQLIVTVFIRFIFCPFTDSALAIMPVSVQQALVSNPAGNSTVTVNETYVWFVIHQTHINRC